MSAFRHLPVLSLEDVTANFEQLLPILGGEGTTSEPGSGAGGSIDTGWLAPVFKNSWTSLETTPGYRRQKNVVRLRGQVKGGTTGTVAFELPVGFRPTQRYLKGVYASGAVLALIVVEAGGSVSIFFGGTSGKEQTVLDGVTFTID